MHMCMDMCTDTCKDVRMDACAHMHMCIDTHARIDECTLRGKDQCSL